MGECSGLSVKADPAAPICRALFGIAGAISSKRPPATEFPGEPLGASAWHPMACPHGAFVQSLRTKRDELVERWSCPAHVGGGIVAVALWLCWPDTEPAA